MSQASSIGSPGDTRTTVLDNFTLMKSDDTTSAVLAATHDGNNVITTFESLESEIGQGSSEKKNQLQESPGLRRRRPVPAVPQVVMGKHNEPK